MNTAYPLEGYVRPHLWRRLALPWIAFWLIMLVVGMEEYLWSGGKHVWEPLVNYGSAALATSVLAVMQTKRARRLDDLLGYPLRWFIRMWTWMPLQLVGYVITVYALRIGSYRLAGARLHHGPWSQVFAYEATKFVLFYLLFGGIHFGLQSYAAWANERLRTEQQANLARQAQLLQLTQQLQPHFLFNALNTISSLIHSAPDTADLLLTRLATLLRAATDASRRPEQSFAEELALLRAYAEIMTQRFSDRVQISWEIDAGAQACRVPTLGLQPLLENCFRHVVERHNGVTHIAIRARPTAGSLRIEIEDDGDLKSLPTARGIGLGNLEERLQSMYGTRAGLSLRLRSGGGLIVQVELPCAH